MGPHPQLVQACSTQNSHGAGLNTVLRTNSLALTHLHALTTGGATKLGLAHSWGW